MKDYEIKIELLFYGVKLSNRIKNELTINGKIKLFNDYITYTGIMINFNEQYVTCKLNEDSPYIIDYLSNQICIKKGNNIVKDITIIEPAKYMINNELNKYGQPYSDYVVVHKYRARIQPIDGCAYDCRFCNDNSYEYHKNPIKLLDDALQKAIKENEIRNLLISAGTPKRNNLDYEYQNNVYKYFAKKYINLPIDIMTAPRGIDINKSKESHIAFFKMLKSLNIADLSINLELYNEDARKKYIPLKNYYTRQEYLDYMELATKYLGDNIVKSGIIVGLENESDTLKAVEELAKRKIRVILSPYIPFNNIGYYPTPEMMKRVLLRSKEITHTYGSELSSKYIWCRHNEISF